MNIRFVSTSDVEGISLLFRESVLALAAPHYDDRQRRAWALGIADLDEWRGRLSRLQVLVACEGDDLAGFIAYDPKGHIEMLYVSPQSARRGIATALYRHAEAALVILGVREFTTHSSIVARPFFAGQGFTVDEEQDVIRGGVTLRRYAMHKRVPGPVAR